MPRFSALPVFLVFLTVLGSGCGSSPTPAEQFKLDQEGVVTSHGRIDDASVEEMPNGQIKFRTTDGQSWQVSRTVRSDGSRDYGTPVAAAPESSGQSLVEQSRIAKKEGQQAGQIQPVVP
jgi:hypothetical protein